jgi:Mg-chelatase subunit ChlD
LKKDLNLAKKKKQPTLNTYIVLDRSGSMVNQWSESLGAVNGYVQKLVEDKTQGTITVVAFDNVNPYEVLRDKVNLAEYTNLTTAEVSPRGMTPLYDATGKAILNALSDNAEKTLLLIMTDGHENSSREFNQTAVKTLIKEVEGKGWEVVFLGANFDASTYTQTLGMSATKFANTFDASMLMSRGVQMAAKATAYASGFATMDLTPEEQAENQ